MARRRRKESLAESIGGGIMMIVALAILSPAFRGQVVSLLSMVIAIALLVGVVVLVVYLLVQLRKPEDVPVRPARPITKVFSHNTNHEQARIQDVIASMVPQSRQTPSRPASWNDTVLSVIEWKRFEVVTKEFLNLAGYVAHETKVGADGGVDIRVTKPDTEGFEAIVQCKAWNSYRVGVKPVRELYGIMAAEKVTKGMLITSGDFTAEAEEFAKGKITLISGAKFLELIRNLPEEKQKRLLDVALEGDYQTPTCPQCDMKMVLREGKKGKNLGSQFWGCPRYPRCRQTLVYKEQA